MDQPFLCRSMLVCDEIRDEVGGKQIIIGAYSGVILLSLVPFYGKLTLRFEINIDKPHVDHAECTILRPNGSIFYHYTKPFDVKFPLYPNSIVFTLTENFEHIGIYAVLLAMDSTPIRVGDFEIVTADSLTQNT